jgi:RecA/RadA recombinase
MSSLMERMIKSGSINSAAVLSDSAFFGEREPIPTDLPILNIAFSGSLDGGLLPGLTMIAGASKSFKTMLSLYCMKAYLDKYKDGIAILYDSEFGITPDYLEGIGVETSRVIHIPIENVEQLKFDIVKRLGEVGKKDKVFIMIDSIGNLSSLKESQDAENEKSVTDMTRAKSLKSLFRIITPYLTIKKIPCIAINHIYLTQEMYSKAVVSGGTGIYYSSNTIFIISKAQEKDGDELAGWKFTINIEKSRYVKEKSKLPFTVLYDSGIQKWSALFDLAQESGHLVKPKMGWYNIVDMETGEISEKSYRAKDIQNNTAFFEKLTKDQLFKDFITKKYKLSAGSMISPPDTDEEVDISEEE